MNFQLLKVDIMHGSCLEWYEPFCYPSEPIFVASPDAQSEDDGIILATLLWTNEENLQRIGLIILCARTWIEIGRCIFHLPTPVPKCLHGWFVQDPSMIEESLH